ncbi:protein translocase subunit SecD [Lutispora sp.]|uniref:protein translocase subunit SecD n=1 Tax=Lutispora sp. TaxID=2828727 RepID=UPI000ED79430|nr:protein translocase subunit SecD [Lutispora sp.]MEA4963514.1 protein translocase subunit SecD [Lutispora sp.]HCJ56507.1 protein translocase subunit SecD [Clostridiaceae bacterium]
MNSKNIVKFLAIVALIGILSYVAAYGLQLGKYEVIPVKNLIKLGLDLRGGAEVVLEAQDNPNDPVTDEKIERAIATIRERIDSLGVTEPTITRQGAKRIRIGLPEIQDTQRALEVIGKTAQLKFVDEAGNTVLTGNDIKEAKAVYASQSQTGIQEPVVSLELTSEGAKKFALATSNNVGKIIAIYLDESVISAPQVNEAITDGKCQISGRMTMEEAADLAMLIRAGALPVELKTLQVTSIGPELGANSFDKSLAAGGIGILLVLVFMILYYRLPGLVADITLVLYICIVLFALAALQATLTLPGIAGIVLSIGMAVDANVIIFERLKEELKLGKSLRAAIDSGFRRAFLTIFDSNITTLIAAVVLFYFGTGPIKGFAVTLSIGILASMFTAIVVTKQLMKLVSSISALSNKKLYGA